LDTAETEKAKRTYVEIYLRLDQFTRIYKREEYDILSFAGDMGGLASVVILFG